MNKPIQLYPIFATVWAIGMLVWIAPNANIVTSNQNQPCDYHDLQCRLDVEKASTLNHLNY